MNGVRSSAFGKELVWSPGEGVESAVAYLRPIALFDSYVRAIGGSLPEHRPPAREIHIRKRCGPARPPDWSSNVAAVS